MLSSKTLNIHDKKAAHASRFRRFINRLKSFVTDKRLLALLGSLVLGTTIKSIVFLMSAQIVTAIAIATGVQTHGLSIGIGDFLVLEHFDDWKWYYEVFVQRFLQGNLLYTPALYEIVPGDQSYVYPPLFLYMLVAFSFLPVEFNIMAGIVFIDLVTGTCLFLIALRITHSIPRAVLASLIYYLNPILLWWTDYLWFGDAVYNAFMTLGFLCLIEKRFMLAALFLALSCMIKQLGVIFVPVLFIFAYRDSLSTFLKALLIVVGVAVLLSLPYLVIMPYTYLRDVTSSTAPFMYIDQMPPFNSPVQLFASFWFLPQSIRNGISIAIASYIPLAAFMGLLFSQLLFWTSEEKENWQYHLVGYSLLLVAGFYTLFPRGIFKWYLVAFATFFAMATICIPGRVSARIPFADQALPWYQRILAKLNFRLTLGLLFYFTISFALTWCHRWMGPGILLLTLVVFGIYWLRIGRKESFPSFPPLENT
jgi:Gpi18-like mannosyltransferase